MMQLVYGLMCDYAVAGGFQKPTIVGVFTVMQAPEPPAGGHILTVPCHLHAMIESPSAIGPRHVLMNRLVDSDGETIVEGEIPITFHQKITNPASQFAYTYGRFHPVVLPGFGDYEWVFLVDGVRIGSVPFSMIREDKPVQ